MYRIDQQLQNLEVGQVAHFWHPALRFVGQHDNPDVGHPPDFSGPDPWIGTATPSAPALRAKGPSYPSPGQRLGVGLYITEKSGAGSSFCANTHSHLTQPIQ